MLCPTPNLKNVQTPVSARFEQHALRGSEEFVFLKERDADNSPHRLIRHVVSLLKLLSIVVKFLQALNPSKVEEFDINKVQILIGLQRNPKRELDSCESKCSRLQFIQDIPRVVYTGENIIVKGTSLDIALVDAATGHAVKYGPEASAKVEIVVLNGDVYPDSGIWTADQLSDHIVWGKERNVNK